MLKVLVDKLGIGLAVAAAFLIGVLWTEVRYLKKGVVAGTATDTGAAAQQPQQQAPQQQVVLTDDQWQEVLKNPAVVIGKDSAPVTMVEFTDYQCPFCSRHYDTHKQLVDKYVKAGKLRIVVRDLPLSFHPFASLGAQAARCAGVQGKYEAMHNVLFEKQTEWTAAGATEESVKKAFESYAKAIGADSGKLMSCVNNGDQKKAVEADAALAAKVGATGTPTFYINKEQVVGAQPLSVFQAAIDKLL